MFGDPNRGRADGAPGLTMRVNVRERLWILAVTVMFVGCGTASEPSADATLTAIAAASEAPSAIATLGPPASPSDAVEATIQPSPTVEPTVAATPTPTRKPVVTPKPTPRPTKTPAPSWSINAQIDKTRYWNDPSWLLIYIAVSGTVPKDATSPEYDLSCDMGLALPSGQSLTNHFSGSGTNGYMGPSFGWNLGAWGQGNIGTAHWTIDCYNTTGSPRYEHRSDSGTITVPPEASPAP
jgi:hypothetical protein